MKYLIDTHVHIYPFQRADMTLESLLANMDPGDTEAHRMACLTERYDCFLFDRIAEDALAATSGRFQSRRIDRTLLELTHVATDRVLYLLAGQQIVTSENIEVLGLNMPCRIEEGLDAVNTVSAVLETGGFPVVAWAPGKWFGTRGKVVRNLLDRFSSRQIALGDTSLRPRGWGTPFIMRTAQSRGYSIFSGSDPLPLVGEERRAGSYYSEVRGVDADPGELVRRLFELPSSSIRSSGRRPLPGTVLQRLLAHKRASSRPTV